MENLKRGSIESSMGMREQSHVVCVARIAVVSDWMSRAVN